MRNKVYITEEFLENTVKMVFKNFPCVEITLDDLTDFLYDLFSKTKTFTVVLPGDNRFTRRNLKKILEPIIERVSSSEEKIIIETSVNGERIYYYDQGCDE